MIDAKTNIGTVVIRDELDNRCLEGVKSSCSQLGRSLAKSDYEERGEFLCIETGDSTCRLRDSKSSYIYYNRRLYYYNYK
jgi:chorismate-pyruvate lyase